MDLGGAVRNEREQGSNFVLNESRSFDALQALKVCEHIDGHVLIYIHL